MIANCKFQIFGGGPLATKIGHELVAAGVKLSSSYGTTEVGTPTAPFRENQGRSPLDWQYTRFSSRVNVRFIPQPDGVTYESEFLVRGLDRFLSGNLYLPIHQDSEFYKVCAHNLPDVKGFSTNDLWVPHPTKPDLWKMWVDFHIHICVLGINLCDFRVGRRDDVLILASGENVAPDPLENHIIASALVLGIVVFGHGRNQVGALVEPQPGVDVSDIGAFKDLIW